MIVNKRGAFHTLQFKHEFQTSNKTLEQAGNQPGIARESKNKNRDSTRDSNVNQEINNE